MQNYKEFLIDCFQKLKKFKNINIEDEKINVEYKIKDDEPNSLFIEFVENEIETEYNEVKSFGEYYIATDKAINFILFDTLGVMKDKEFTIENSLCRITLTKDIGDDVLLFNVFKHIVEFSKVDQVVEKSLCSELIREDVVAVYLQWNYDNKDIVNDEFEINKIINSVLCFLSVSKGFVLDNPYNILNNKHFNLPLEVDFKLATNREPVQYFLQAEKLDMPHFKYLEYYHVLEYYFLHHKIEEIDKMIKELVAINMIENDKGKDRTYFYKLAELYKYYSEDNDKREDKQLEFLIREYLGFRLIKSILEKHFENYTFLKEIKFDISETIINIDGVIDKKSKGKKFLDRIEEKDKMLFCNAIAKRIYKIRNNIVHTKKYEKDEVFTPTQSNFDSIKDDLKFIRLLAYSMMTK